MKTKGMAALAIAMGAGALMACGGGDTQATSQGSGGSTSSGTHAGGSVATNSGGAGGTDASGGGGAGGQASCPRALGPADAIRVVVVSHPFGADSNPAPLFEVLELSEDGKLSRPNRTFSMSPTSFGKMAFTPDGKVGIVPDDDGDLGVVRFDDERKPTVVHAKFHGSFYATGVVIEPGGDSALILNGQTRDNGGGIYRVRIGCDGKLTDEGLIAAAKLPGGLQWLKDDKHAVVASADFLDAKAGDSADLLELVPAPKVLGGADAFGDDGAIVSAIAVTHDEKFALIADDSQFGNVPPRIAVVGVGASGITAINVFQEADEMITDPVDLATSPFDNAALVVSGFDNAIFAMGYDPSNGAAPFTMLGELAYQGQSPQLPLVATPITRGKLNGLVLVSEVSGIRTVRFEASGEITDLGLLSLGDGEDLPSATGAMGVSP